MDDSLDVLTRRLRAAESFTAIAAAIIEELGAWEGVDGVAVEAHDADGPCLWLGSPAFDPVAAQRYLDGNHVDDEGLARLQRALVPLREQEGAWLCPIVGCGELCGVIRLRVAAGVEWAAIMSVLCVRASVRLAQLGGVACEALGASVLTARQQQVAVLVARGATNGEIGQLLSISANAVKKHVSRALEALDVSNRTELAALASQWAAGPRPAVAPAIRVLRRPCSSRHFPYRRNAA